MLIPLCVVAPVLGTSEKLENTECVQRHVVGRGRHSMHDTWYDFRNQHCAAEGGPAGKRVVHRQSQGKGLFPVAPKDEIRDPYGNY